jgi:hypothetical protein
LLQKFIGKLLDIPILLTEDVAKQVLYNIFCTPVAIVKLPCGSIIRCYEPAEDISSACEGEEWMYQLQQSNTLSFDINDMFDHYLDIVKLPPPADSSHSRITFVPLDTDTESVKKLKSVMNEYPRGITVQYTP